MRKLLTSVFCIVTAVLCLVSCAAPAAGGVKRENRLSSPFTSKMTISLDKLTAEGTITRYGDSRWEADFDSPNTLSGVTLAFDGGNVTASYKGLSFSVPRSAVPVKAMLCNLIEAVDTNAKNPELSGSESEGMLCVNGSLEGGDYTLSIDSSGCISAFEMPNNLLKIAFTDVIINGSPEPVTETTTADTAETSAASA